MTNELGKDFHRLNMEGVPITKIAERFDMKYSRALGIITRYRKKHDLPGPGKRHHKSNGIGDFIDRSLEYQSTCPDAPKTFAEVIQRNCCRYIAGDHKEGTDTYCGLKPAPGSSYCIDHHRLCNTVPRKEIMDTAGIKKAVRA